MRGGSTAVGKLVRDRIPDIIRASGRTPHVTIMRPDTYRRALIDKLREEVAELAAAPTTESLVEEAADVLGVLTAIAVEHGADLATIGDIARAKRNERGGFDRRLCLDDVDPLHTGR
ncbi:phosphoribosyl-ATP pyrophosphohydrolase [Mycolicibacterium gadium]|uniref:Phosphoribosyl-ATP pyrophosphohydrolase n=1 Tax=Mycolicibacterium gadium TaxID=1794 RepID=A0A7I7WNT0_MYCGU|nr:phosphoribosyl-ATP pyrophosphohydrolase [Mycolicibacterium gadium]